MTTMVKLRGSDRECESPLSMRQFIDAFNRGALIPVVFADGGKALATPWAITYAFDSDEADDS